MDVFANIYIFFKNNIITIIKSAKRNFSIFFLCNKKKNPYFCIVQPHVGLFRVSVCGWATYIIRRYFALSGHLEIRKISIILVDEKQCQRPDGYDIRIGFSIPLGIESPICYIHIPRGVWTLLVYD